MIIECTGHLPVPMPYPADNAEAHKCFFRIGGHGHMEVYCSFLEYTINARVPCTLQYCYILRTKAIEFFSSFFSGERFKRVWLLLYWTTSQIVFTK